VTSAPILVRQLPALNITVEGQEIVLDGSARQAGWAGAKRLRWFAGSAGESQPAATLLMVNAHLRNPDDVLSPTRNGVIISYVLSDVPSFHRFRRSVWQFLPPSSC
jgi:hypothetical protein